MRQCCTAAGRKRVNIGMELVADPTLLALDEPTSGLDSSTSMMVLRALKKVNTVAAHRFALNLSPIALYPSQ